MVSLPIPAKGVGRETGARVQISPAPPLIVYNPFNGLYIEFFSKNEKNTCQMHYYKVKCNSRLTKWACSSAG